MLDIAPEDLTGLHEIERDDHGHLRIAEVNIGEILKAQVAERLRIDGDQRDDRGQEHRLRAALRRPDPIGPGYTRDLGYCAAKFLLAGGNAAMISIQGGRFVPIPFTQMLDGAPDGRTRVRLVDTASTRYAIARRYMIRLRRDDFEDPHAVAKLAATARLSECFSLGNSSIWSRPSYRRSPWTRRGSGWHVRR